MNVSMGKTKWQKFENYALLIILVLVGLGYAASKIPSLFSPDERQVAVSGYITNAQQKGISCSYSGFVFDRKSEVERTFLTCNPNSVIPGEVNSKEELFSSIGEHVITPAIEYLPKNEMGFVIAITQIDQNMVVCTNVERQEITQQWLDSYDNYCMPG
ncbi:hypothetical protein [Microbulbifer sp. JMSA003]|uniref:hypothetical protein n=1 Tax=Microbulbifer sp. JMSA003 TaxID=3243369 RepID=UPI004039C407